MNSTSLHSLALASSLVLLLLAPEPSWAQMNSPSLPAMRRHFVPNTPANSIGHPALRRLAPDNSDVHFFGETFRTHSICILVDTSSSIVHEGHMDTIRGQLQTMMGSMDPSTKFNLVVFTDGAADFKSELVAATPANTQESIEWFKKAAANRLGNDASRLGNTPFVAIQHAVDQEAETVIIVTDDPPFLENDAVHAKTMMDYVAALARIPGDHPVQINVILLPAIPSSKSAEAKKYYSDLARKTGGKCTVWKHK